MTSKMKPTGFLTVILGFILLTAALITYGASMRGTHALLTDTEVSTGNTFTAGTWEADPGWTFSPGKSKATWPDPGKPPLIAQDVAQYENDELILDFGDIRAGNCNNSNDVFRIRNDSSAAVTVSFSLSPEIAGYFSVLGFSDGDILAPGQEKCVEMKLDTTPATPSCIYEGVLTISCGDGYTEMTIPVRFEVLSP